MEWHFLFFDCWAVAQSKDDLPTSAIRRHYQFKITYTTTTVSDTRVNFFVCLNIDKLMFGSETPLKLVRTHVRAVKGSDMCN